VRVPAPMPLRSRVLVRHVRRSADHPACGRRRRVRARRGNALRERARLRLGHGHVSARRARARRELSPRHAGCMRRLRLLRRGQRLPDAGCGGGELRGGRALCRRQPLRPRNDLLGHQSDRRPVYGRQRLPIRSVHCDGVPARRLLRLDPQRASVDAQRRRRRATSPSAASTIAIGVLARSPCATLQPPETTWPPPIAPPPAASAWETPPSPTET